MVFVISAKKLEEFEGLDENLKRCEQEKKHLEMDNEQLMDRNNAASHFKMLSDLIGIKALVNGIDESVAINDIALAKNITEVRFIWRNGGSKVFVAGSWDDFKFMFPLRKTLCGNYFVTTLRLRKGQKYTYKYNVNGEWRLNGRGRFTPDGRFNVVELSEITTQSSEIAVHPPLQTLKITKNIESSHSDSNSIRKFDSNDDLNSDVKQEITLQSGRKTKSVGKKQTKMPVYSIADKIEILEFAQKSSMHQASRHFKVDRHSIRDWRRKEKELYAALQCELDTNGKNGNAAEEQSSDDLQPNQKYWTDESEDGDKEYEIERVMERRSAYFVSGSSEWEYRIKWKGYVEETWEPIANIAHLDIVKEFIAKETAIIGKKKAENMNMKNKKIEGSEKGYSTISFPQQKDYKKKVSTPHIELIRLPS